MRVAYILRAEFGLLGANASYMLPSVVARYHEVMVLTSPTGPAEANLAVFQDDRLSIVRLQSATLRERVGEAMTHLERFKPDIVHVFNFKDCLLYPVFARHSMAIRPKWLLDIRTPLLEEDRTSRRRQRLKNLLLQGYIHQITTHEAASVKTHFPAVFRPTAVVRPGVDLSHFRAPQCREGEIRRYIYVGSVARRRKLDVLITAFAHYAKAVRGDVSLCIYGGGNRLEEMRKLVRRLRLTNVIRLHGPVGQEELFRLMPTYDAAIAYVPRGAFDNAPALKLLEYAAAGLPIFASDLPGLRRLEARGFHVHWYFNGRHSFARTLAAHRDQAMENEGRMRNWRAVQDFDWGHIVQTELLPVYDRLAGGAE